MIRNKFLNKLRKKYQTGGLQMDRGYGNPLVDPYVSLGSKNIVTDFGSRAAFGGKISVPILSSSTRGGTFSSLRGEGSGFIRSGGRQGIGALEAQLGPNHPAVREGLPEYLNTEPKVSNTALGVRGIYNTQLGRRGNTILRSNVGVGMGTGDASGEFYRYNTNAFGDIELNRGTDPSSPGPLAKPYADANVSLLKRFGRKGVAGVTGSYGTDRAPDPGLRVGVTGSYGPLTGNIGYDATNNAVRAGVGLTFQKGGVRYNTLDKIQDSLTVGGLTPGVGIIPDAINTGISGIRAAYNYATGDTARAKSQMGDLALNAASIIPIAGQAAGVTKLAKTAKKVFKTGKKGKAAYSIVESTIPQTPTPTFIPIARNYADINAGPGVGPLASKANQSLMQMGGMYDQPQMMREGGEDDNTMPDKFKIKKKGQQYLKKGGMALPGGMMKPIPGSDAVEFKGRSHEEGGIMVDPQTEVEGGETMDQVNMAKKGGKRDYFFSSFLKKGGRSFAQMHKDILRKGGDQEDINMLAKMQEKAAGRNPKKVARLGGIVEYRKGGINKYETGGAQKEYDAHEANKPTFDLKPPTPPKEKRNPNKIQAKQYRDALAQYNEDLAKYNAAKQEYESDLAEWEVVENELSRAVESEEALQEIEEREAQEKADQEQAQKDAKKAENDALIKEARDLGITLPEGSIKLSELKTLINRAKEDAKLEKKRKGEKSFLPGTEGIPETQPSVTIGGKQYFLDDPQLQQYITSEGENFGDTWMSNVDPEVLESAGIKSFTDLQTKENVLKYQKAYNKKYPDRAIEEDGLLGEETLNTGMPTKSTTDDDIKEETLIDEVEVNEKTDKEITTDDTDDGGGTVNLDLTDRIDLNIPDINQTNYADLFDTDDGGDDDGRKKDKRGIPTEAYLGMAAGLLPAAYAYFHKQPPAEQAGYTQGFRRPIIAERGKAPKLERYDYNQDIANVGSEVRGMNKYIETSGGGPANMINKMMAFGKGQEAKMKIRAAETRANIGVQNTEAQLEQQMTLDNLRRAQQASIFNAQMSRAETARMDQVDEANTARRQKRIDDMEYMKYSGISTAGTLLQQSFGDILDYKADMAKAEAIGTGAGNVNRDAALIAAGYSLDTNTGVWSKGGKTVNRFGGLKRLLNYKK